MWRSFHILTDAQAFLVSSIFSALIAASFAVRSGLQHRGGSLADLWWPQQFDPLVSFGAVFVFVLPVVLAYYHFGRLGVILAAAASAIAYCGMHLFALYLFVIGAVFGAVAYPTICLLLYLSLFLLHRTAAASPRVAGLQRSLGLVPSTGMR
jgi:amino acid permease